MSKWLMALALLIATFPDTSYGRSLEEIRAIAAREYAKLNPSPAPTPNPGPKPGDVCPQCNGTGKVGDGVVSQTCIPCNGTGRVLATAQRTPGCDCENCTCDPCTCAVGQAKSNAAQVKTHNGYEWTWVNGQWWRGKKVGPTAAEVRSEATFPVGRGGWYIDGPGIITYDDGTVGSLYCPGGRCPATAR